MTVPRLPQTGQIDQASLSWLLGTTAPPVYVSQATVKGLPAIGAGVDRICHAVATMMASADVFDEDDAPVDVPQIVKQPHPIYDSYEFYRQIVEALIYYGNYYAIPVEGALVPVHPNSVSVDMQSGLPVYEILGTRYQWDEILHIRRNPGVGTVVGIGVVTQYRIALQGQLYQQSYGAESWRTGAVPSAVVQLDVDKIADGVAEQVQDDWLEYHGDGQRKPAVVPRSMTITPLSWSPEDAQFIESKQLSIAESALILGFRPNAFDATVGAAGQLSYGNRTEDNVQIVQETYSPYMRLIEQGFTRQLPSGLYVRGNVEALLRATTRERLEIHKLAQDVGLETPNETRAINKKEPIEGGDRIVQSRSVTTTNSERTAA